MIAHQAIQLALRARARTLAVCTTGAIALAATAAGGQDGASAFSRLAGSFYDDGFAVGMELVASGFAASADANNITTTIVALTATLCTIAGVLVDEASGSGRTLAVGLPSLAAWENVEFTPTAGVPYVDEQYLPGPSSLNTIGPNGILTGEPQYALHINVPIGTGISADGAYADALLTLFAPKTGITLTNGDVVRVRGDVAPFRGQRLPSSSPGWSVVPVTIPLRIYTTNAI